MSEHLASAFDALVDGVIAGIIIALLWEIARNTQAILAISYDVRMHMVAGAAATGESA